MEQIKEELLYWSKELGRRGLTSGTSGNLSVFNAESQIMLITPSGLPYSDLELEDLVSMNLQGEVLAGKNKPSSEWQMHTAVYQKRPQIKGVVHTHSLYATALACAGKSLPAVHYMLARAGKEVPLAPYATFGSPELAQNALDAMGENKAVLLANHGLLAIGKDLKEAFLIAEEVEEVAKLFILANSLGHVQIIDHREMEKIEKLFQSYGKPR